MKDDFLFHLVTNFLCFFALHTKKVDNPEDFVHQLVPIKNKFLNNTKFKV